MSVSTTPNDYARDAWSFLRGYVVEAHRFVFSRAGFAWEGLPRERITVIHPSIDAFSPKNADQSVEQSRAILSKAGIVPQYDTDAATFTRSDGTPGRVDRPATIVEDEPLGPEDRLVVQVSRWDGLKDPLGVMGAFAQHVDPASGAHLLLAGPSTEAVADDPEGAQVLASVVDAWHALPGEVRRRVHLASLPMEDSEENAAIVNSVQRAAERGYPEEPRRGLRADRRRGDVEGAAGRRKPDRRNPGPDRRRRIGCVDLGPP